MNPTYLVFLATTAILLAATIVLAMMSLLNRFDRNGRRLLRAYALIAIIGISAIPALAYPHLLERINSPVDLSKLSDRRTPDGVILQSTKFSCAPAALANLARLRGIPTSERDMATLCKTTRYGTTPQKMLSAASAIGLNYRLTRNSENQLSDLPELSILFVDHPATGPESHSIVFLRRSNLDTDQFEIVDPLVGRSIIGVQELQMIFHGSLLEPIRH